MDVGYRGDRVVMGGSLELFCVGRFGAGGICWFVIGQVCGVCGV